MNQTVARKTSGWVWAAFLLLCAIAAAAAIRRIVALALPPVTSGVPELSALDAGFRARKVLTLVHIVPALGFVALLLLWFLPAVRRRKNMHRRVMHGLMILGAIVGVTAFLLSLHPVGGVNESAASILYDGLFLFSMGRAWLLFHRGEMALHRTWMIRGISVLLGIATTRPVMGVFFATARVTHLHPQQFFGTAFWIGFTVTYMAGEGYLRSHPGG